MSSSDGCWESNFAALTKRDPQLAQRIAVAPSDAPSPTSVSIESATQIAAKLFPTGQCTQAVMVAGLDQGHLWRALHALPVHVPHTPGHRPPLFFLARDAARFAAMLREHDCIALLADPRVQIFVGEDAVAQSRHFCIAHPNIPWPRLCATVDPRLWKTGETLDSLLVDANRAASIELTQHLNDIETHYAPIDRATLHRRFNEGHLRVLGITSRFTTFLQHSMRDWLDGLRRLGHDTRMCIESADHEICGPLAFARLISDFRPELIVMIDHYRSELRVLPKQIPCVMWVQDQLPNIFSPAGGAAQGPLDYCLGFGRLQLRDTCGYPEHRFMPAQVGVNENRFAPRQLSASEIEKYGCDASFVSHASTPATMLLTEKLKAADATGRKLLVDVFEQIRAIYDAGDALYQPRLIGPMIDASLQRLRATVTPAVKISLVDFFNQKINNALFRHQALGWVADLGIDLRIYGNGWEKHPRFARHARGPACNESELCSIYQASKINLQITPFGAVHQRLFDGLAAGGFFLLRRCGGDIVEPIYRELHRWCEVNGIQDDQMLLARATPWVHAQLNKIERLLNWPAMQLSERFMDVLALSHEGGYMRSAASIWPEYDQVSFDSPKGLIERVSLFLSHSDSRERVSGSMRRSVIEHFSYSSTSRRLIEFIATDLVSQDVPQRMAA